MTEITAYAKVNLTLRVEARRRGALHALVSLAQSIDVSDRLTVTAAEEDSITVDGDDLVALGEDNLAWRAAAAVREHLGAAQPLRVHLRKRVPVAAGLGGGSADAAAALVAASGLLGGDRGTVTRLAPALGSDVPFCVIGGTVWIRGTGEQLRAAEALTGFHLAVATAPFPLETGAVFRRWDDLDRPVGPGVSGRSIPPSLRHLAPLVNDLTPAALSLHPELGDWAADLARSWGQPVMMSGSGPTMFGFFASRAEADDAAAEVAGARFASGASLVDRGWDGSPGGTLPPPPWGVV